LPTKTSVPTTADTFKDEVLLERDLYTEAIPTCHNM
jgi:hypothetical protein